jgi:2-methylcitrate dehydratase PrpD
MNADVQTPAQTRGLTESLARLASEVRYEQLAADVVELARHALLDWFAVTASGSQEELTQILLAGLSPAPEADPLAVTIVGHRSRHAPVTAALINGSASHALDFDDVNAAFLGHVSVAVLPAALALAEQRDANAGELLCAFVAGYDTACRVAAAIGPEPYLRGSHQTGSVGIFGAAAACARLLGLDADATAVALGIAASEAAGLCCNFGTMTKPLHAGRASEGGLLAALLAGRGFTANPAAIEADKGLAAVLGGSLDLARATATGEPGARLRENLFKYHASCFWTHSTLEGLIALLRAGEITPESVQRVVIHVSELELGTCAIAEPRTALEVKFSLAHLAAMVLLGRGTSLIGDEDAHDGAVLAMRSKVELVAGAQPGPPTLVEVISSDGTVSVRSDVGLPERDAHVQALKLTDKFRTLARPVLGERAEPLLRRVLGLRPEDRVRDLMRSAACPG